MNLASAYPNSDISGGTMAVIALVMLAALAFWLVMVYVAAREPHKPRPAGQQPPASGHTAVAAHDDVAEDEQETTVLTG